MTIARCHNPSNDVVNNVPEPEQRAHVHTFDNGEGVGQLSTATPDNEQAEQQVVCSVCSLRYVLRPVHGNAICDSCQERISIQAYAHMQLANDAGMVEMVQPVQEAILSGIRETIILPGHRPPYSPHDPRELINRMLTSTEASTEQMDAAHLHPENAPIQITSTQQIARNPSQANTSTVSMSSQQDVVIPSAPLTHTDLPTLSTSPEFCGSRQ